MKVFTNIQKIVISKMTFIFMALLLTSYLGSAQTSNEYTVDQLADLIADINASAYETYILSTDGGVYDFTEAPDVSATATIKGADNLDNKPVVSFTTNPNNWAGIFRVRNTTEVITLTLENLEFDQSTEIGLLIRSDDQADIVVKNCTIYGNTNSNGSFRIEGAGSTVSLENTLVYDSGQRFINFYTTDVSFGAVSVVNCSFNNIGGPVIYYRSSGGIVAIGTDVTVDHSTFNNIGGTEGVFKFRDMTGTIQITNSIFSNVDGSIEEAFATPDYCYVNGFETVPVATNSIETAPVFADADNNDLTLMNADEMIGGDSQTLGDLSWYDDSSVPNEYTTDQIADLIADINASAHDTYILTTDGGVYDFTEAPDFSATATIKGADDLVNKPVLSFTANPNSWAGIFRVRNTSEVITLTLENLEFDQSNEIGLLVRSDDQVNIHVKDCDIHGNTNSNGCFRIQAGGSTISVENTLVWDSGQRFINFYTTEETYGAVNITNSSFNNIGGPVIYYRSSGGVVAIGTDVTVDHATFNNISGSDGVFKFRDMTGNVQITNSIFSEVAGSIEEAFATPDYCYVNGFETLPVATNSIEVDPIYADAANNNLTLLNADEMIGGDLQIIGDLTWYDDTFAPVVYEELIRVDDTHVSVEFNEIVESESAVLLTNYTLSGTFGLTGNPTSAVLADDFKSVLLEVPDLSTMNFNETVVVTVENVTDLAGNPVGDANVATYTYLDETPPVVTMAQQELNNDPGVVALAQSNETGMIYLIREDQVITVIEDFQTAIDNYVGVGAVVETADTDVQLPVSGILVGNYHAYAVDDFNNISDPSENQVVLTDITAPVVTLDAQEVNNSSGEDPVMVTTNEPGGVYLILEGETVATVADLQAAVDAGNGAMGMVEPGGDLEIGVSMDGVTPGTYFAYAVDLSENISDVSTNSVTVTEYIPLIRYYTDQQTAELSNDIISASDGDVFVLTTDGGDYALEAWHKITAKITIMADRDLVNRPVISNYRESGTYQIFRLFADGSSLTLKGVELNSKEHPTYPVKYMIRADSNIGNYSLVVEDCHFRGVLKETGTILKTYGGTHADSIIFRNCIFEDMEAISMTGLSSEDSPTWDKMEITNCTFMNIPEEAIRIKDQPSVNAEFPIDIDHATFYNVGSETKDVILADSLTKVTVTNSIFANSPSPTIFDIYGDDTNQSTIDYFNYFEANPPVAVGNGVVGTNVWNQDPQFANPSEGDLTLENMTLYSLGSDGLPLGDLRWADVLGPKVLQEVLALTDSTLLIRFSEPIDTTSAITPENYTMSGSAGLTGNVTNVELYNFHAVVITTGSFVGLTDLEIVITVANVEDLSGNVVDPDQNSVTYTVEELMPVVFAEQQDATNGMDQTVTVQASLGSGYVYIILDGVAQETEEDLDNAVAAGNGAKAEVTASYTDVAISTYAITPGIYHAYFVDGSGNMSDKDESIITITDGIAPVVSAEVQSATNGADSYVMVQSSEDNGRVYIMLDGEPQSTLADFLTAVAISNAGVADVTSADTDIEISTSGLTPGIYFAYAIDAAGNISEKGSNPVNITMSTGLETINENAVRVFNYNGNIIVSSENENITQVAIYDISGRKIMNIDGNETNRISAGMDQKGVYIVKVLDASNHVTTSKIIVQ